MIKNRKPYEIWLLITYIAMLAVCLYLNLFSKGQAGGLANLIVNIVMFVIVAIILIDCYIGSFRPIAGIIKDLRRVNAKMEDDAKHTHDFLWGRYKDEKEELFRVPILREQFKDYRYEQDRIFRLDKAYYKCDIEDYLNYDLIDSVIHRNRMNQIAGVMTGLGILGTFIGLSLGLQSFNTGSTAEITNSIEPLMAGIKVAFHTSIYGMVFSLVFNYVYKRILDDAEQTVRSFLAAFKKYVLPDTTADGINRLIELEKQQADTIKGMADKVAYLMSDGLREVLDPQFDRFNDTIVGFANMATKNQMDQLSMVVNAFVSQMNASLGDMFTRLSETVNNTLIVQGENEKQMEKILGEMADKSLKTQEEMADKSLKTQEEMIRELEQITEKSVKSQTKMVRELKEMTNELPEDVRATFDVINENLQGIENHFRETIGQIEQVLSQMNGQIEYSYNGIEQSFVRTARSIEELAGFMQRLEEYYTGGRQI